MDSLSGAVLLDFRAGPFGFDGWTGGSKGVDAVIYAHTGHARIVRSDYDPPSATDYRRKLWND